jgi:hypothetical protein
MTDDKIALQELLEKSSDASLLREMIGFGALAGGADGFCRAIIRSFSSNSTWSSLQSN